MTPTEAFAILYRDLQKFASERKRTDHAAKVVGVTLDVSTLDGGFAGTITIEGFREGDPSSAFTGVANNVLRFRGESEFCRLLVGSPELPEACRAVARECRDVYAFQLCAGGEEPSGNLVVPFDDAEQFAKVLAWHRREVTGGTPEGG